MRRFIIDGHCDTITRLMERNQELIKNDGHIDIEKLNTFDSPVQFFAVWLDKKYYVSPLKQALNYIEFYNNQLDKYNKYIQKVSSLKDIKNNRLDHKISAVLTLEGGEPLEGKISNLTLLYNLGVRAITLTWNYDNEIAGGASGNSGITEFGYNVISEMQKLGIIIDVSHLSEKSFWELDKVVDLPYIASHSNVKRLCNHNRNLTDEQIKAIANKNGTIGINLYNNFLVTDKVSIIDDIINHIDYIIKLVGDDYVGFGCDFDGIEKTPKQISSYSDLNLIVEAIISKYGDNTAEKILDRNLLRVISEVWK